MASAEKLTIERMALAKMKASVMLTVTVMTGLVTRSLAALAASIQLTQPLAATSTMVPEPWQRVVRSPESPSASECLVRRCWRRREER